MKIAICDDDIQEVETIRSHILTHKEHHEILEFTSAEPLLKRIYGGEHFDLLFLDVQMPDADGWEIAKELKDAKFRLFIAMVTVMGEYISECFNRVDWFTEKPITQSRTHMIIDIAHEKIFPNAFEFQTEKGMISLTVPEIYYIEASHNDIYIYATSGVMKTRLSLRELDETLNYLRCFARVHNSFILNLLYLDRVDKNAVVLKNGKRLPISRSGRKVLITTLDNYIGGDLLG